MAHSEYVKDRAGSGSNTGSTRLLETDPGSSGVPTDSRPTTASSITRRGWIRRLLAQCMLHRRTALGALGVTMIAALIDISFPLLTRLAIDDASAGKNDVIAGVAIAIALLGALRFACQFGRRMLAGRLSIDVQHDLRMDLLA